MENKLTQESSTFEGSNLFHITGENVVFSNSVLTSTSIDMTCGLVSRIISCERTKGNMSDLSDCKAIIIRLRMLLWNVKNVFAYTESEVLKAQILLERFYTRNSNLGISGDFVDIVVVCLLLAHKISNDSPYSNFHWSNVCNIDHRVLNNSEVYFLIHMDYSTWITESEYQEKEHMLGALKNQQSAE
jgi:hypothetical protein